MISTEELLAKAEKGTLSKEELANAVRRLQDSELSLGERVDILRATSIVGAIQYTPEIEFFLHQGDEYISHLALHILFYWHSDGRYNGYILDKLNSKPEDEDYAGLHYTAISLAGEWLRTNNGPKLLSALLSLLQDEDEEVDMRGAAYEAIARAMGVNWLDLPSLAREFDLSIDIDKSVVTNAENRLARMLQIE